MRESLGRKTSNSGNLAVLLSIGVMAVAIAAIYFFLMPKQAADYGAKLQVFPSFSGVLLEGKEASAKIFSSCGSFSVYLDGQKLGDFEQRAEVPISAGAGDHVLEAKNSQCSEKFEFEVKQAECSGNETRTCAVDGCPGAQVCTGGFFGSCNLPKKICVPGQRVGCSSSTCSFGYKTCNKCGTDYSPCSPDGSVNASAANCSLNASCYS